MLRYKIVETTMVTDEELERIVNEWVAQGWDLEGFQFVTHEASRRPSMAFIMFTADFEEEDEDEFEEEDEDLEAEPAN